MEKRILNIATFARMYFEKLGKIYDETNSKQRQAADKNFRRILKKGELDLVVFEQVEKEYLEQLIKEMQSIKPPNT